MFTPLKEVGTNRSHLNMGVQIPVLDLVFMMETSRKGQDNNKDHYSACRSDTPKSQTFSVTSNSVASWGLLDWIMASL